MAIPAPFEIGSPVVPIRHDRAVAILPDVAGSDGFVPLI
jgi:hypothetical protein